MAHNLWITNGNARMAYAGDTPWHRLGTRLSSVATIADAMKAAGLDYDIRLEHMFLQNGTQVPDRRAVIRSGANADDAILGTVGPTYVPVVNRDAFAIADDLCSQGCRVEAAGALGQGERAWLLIRMPDSDQTIGQSDTVRGYFLLHTSHDGTLALGGRATPIRVVCQNTLSAAVSANKMMFSIRHTASAPRRMDEAKRILGLMHESMIVAGQTFADLAQKNMGPKDVAEYIAAVLPADRDKGEVSPTLEARRRTIARLVYIGRGADLAGSDANSGQTTYWGAYNAVCEYLDHVRVTESTTPGGKLSSDVSSLFGASNTIKDQALRIAVAA